MFVETVPYFPAAHAETQEVPCKNEPSLQDIQKFSVKHVRHPPLQIAQLPKAELG